MKELLEMLMTGDKRMSELTTKYMSGAEIDELVKQLNTQFDNNGEKAKKWLLTATTQFPDSPALHIVQGEVGKVLAYLKFFNTRMM